MAYPWWHCLFWRCLGCCLSGGGRAGDERGVIGVDVRSLNINETLHVFCGGAKALLEKC